MFDFRRLASSSKDPTTNPDSAGALPAWATSGDFADFERGSEAEADPAVYRRSAPTPAERAIDQGEAAAYWTPVQARGGQAAADAAAQRRAEATRQRIFSDFDKRPQDEIDAGRWIRQNAFGAKPNAHNILQDKIDLYDPVFSSTLREALRNATPAEIDFINGMRNPARVFASGRWNGGLNLTENDKQMFIGMMERAGPNGQKVAKAAREQWGIPTKP